METKIPKLKLCLCGKSLPFTHEYFHWKYKEERVLQSVFKPCVNKNARKYKDPLNEIRDAARRAEMSFRADKISTDQLREAIKPLYGVGTELMVNHLRSEMGLCNA